jgi:hypothetical protein
MKRLGAAAVAVALVLAVAPAASAFTHDVGTPGVGRLSPIAFGGLVTCDDMAFTGHVTSNNRTYGTLGGTFRFDTASFENCSPGVTVTSNFPVSFSVDPVGGYGVGLDVNITTRQGTCRYSATLWGAGGARNANVGGDVYRLTAGCGGPSQFAARTNLSYSDRQGGEL